MYILIDRLGLNHPRCVTCQHCIYTMTYENRFVGFAAEPLACGNQSTYNSVAKTVKVQ